jgi:RNA polymerase sigma-70 factor (ECF subfamily)
VEHGAKAVTEIRGKMVRAVNNSSRTNRLLQRLSTKDGQAPEELFALHHERLRKMIHFRLDRRLRGKIRSAEILQEVYREAGRHIDKYLADPELPFFLWLRRLTGERIQSLHLQCLGAQAQGAGQELSLYRGALPEVNSVSLAAQLIGNRAVNQSAVRAELLMRLQDALNSMDVVDREILSMCHFEELRDEEVAQVLGIDKGAAALRYIRALKQLREILRNIPGFFDHP